MISGLLQLLRQITRPAVIACWLIVSLVVAYAGPFGTYLNWSASERLAYWGTLIGVSIVMAYATRMVVDRVLPGIAAWIRHVLFVVAFSVSYSLVVWYGFGQVQSGGTQSIDLLVLVFFVALITAGIALVRTLLGYDALPESEGEPLAGPGPALLARVDARAHGPILWLSARDHYVDVVTETGRDSVLMRFADAIRELDGLDGLQVHRSHWVARRAVVGAERRAGRVVLMLANGDQVPVSRSYVPAVEEAGFL